MLRWAMEKVIEIMVPLVSDICVGNCWYDTK